MNIILNEEERNEYKIKNTSYFIKILNYIVNLFLVIDIFILLYLNDITNKKIIFDIIEFFFLYPIFNVSLKNYNYFMIIMFCIYKLIFNFCNIFYLIHNMSYVRTIIISLNNYIIYFLSKLIYYLHVSSLEMIENIINDPFIKQKYLYYY